VGRRAEATQEGCDLARKHGAENVTVLVTMIGGAATNTIVLLSSAEDWAKYGKVQQAFLNDPKVQAVLQEAVGAGQGVDGVDR
jgi:hypothetical protein